MIGTLYRIRAKFTADTGDAERGASRVARSTGRAADQADRARSSFSGLGGILKTVFAGGAVAGVGALTRYVGRLATQAENAEISIASIFSVNKISTFNQGLVRARGLMKRFNEASKQSPGEGRDFLNIFQRTAPTLAKFNPNDKQITTFAGRALAAAFSFNNGDVDLTGDQINQILSGQGGADNKTFNALKGSLFKELGIKAAGSKGTEAFNKIAAKDPERIFNALNTSLKSLDEANAAFGKTFTGMFGSLKQTVNSTLQLAFKPLFGAMNKGFKEALDFLDKNDQGLKDIANVIGDKLVSAWNMLRKTISFVNDNMSIFIALGTGVAMKRAVTMIAASSMGGVGVGPMGMIGGYVRGAGAAHGRIVGGLRAGAGRAGNAVLSQVGNFALAGTGLLPMASRRSVGGMFGRFTNAVPRAVRGAPGAIRRAPGAIVSGVRSGAGRVVSGARAARVAGIGALARNGGSLAMTAANVASPVVMAGVGKGASFAGAGLKALVGGLSKLGVLLLPIVVVVGMVAGAFRVLKDRTNEATTFLRTSWKELKQSLDTLAGQFGFSSGQGGFGSMVKKFADWLGTGVVGVFGLVIKGVERMITAFTYLVAFFKAFGKTMDNAISLKTLTGFGDVFASNLEKALKERQAAYLSTFGDKKKKKPGMSIQDERRALLKFNNEKRKKEAAEAAKKAKRPINIKVTNQVKVITEADPDKIAIRLDQMNATSINNAITAVDALENF